MEMYDQRTLRGAQRTLRGRPGDAQRPLRRRSEALWAVQRPIREARGAQRTLRGRSEAAHRTLGGAPRTVRDQACLHVVIVVVV